ncbi:androgen-dependent TFPI-regulating protein-like [Aphomia sociella]
MLLPVFHLSVVVLNIVAFSYDQLYVDIPFPAKEFEKMPFRARYIFLTMWCFILQTIYFAVSFLNDLFGSNEPTPKRKHLIRTIKDIMFSLAFPIALYVSIAFWALYIFARPLVFPEIVEKMVPIWLNHTIHSLITVFMIIELLVTKRNYPSRTTGCSMIVLFVGAYIVWMHVLYARAGVWPYPIFDVISLPMRIVFCSVSTGFGLAIYVFGEKLNAQVCPNSEQCYSNRTSKKIKSK